MVGACNMPGDIFTKLRIPELSITACIAFDVREGLSLILGAL